MLLTVSEPLIVFILLCTIFLVALGVVAFIAWGLAKLRERAEYSEVARRRSRTGTPNVS